MLILLLTYSVCSRLQKLSGAAKESWLYRATLACCCNGRNQASKPAAVAKPAHRSVRCNIVASISACCVEDLGSSPSGGVWMLRYAERLIIENAASVPNLFFRY